MTLLKHFVTFDRDSLSYREGVLYDALMDLFDRAMAVREYDVADSIAGTILAFERKVVDR